MPAGVLDSRGGGFDTLEAVHKHFVVSEVKMLTGVTLAPLQPIDAGGQVVKQKESKCRKTIREHSKHLQRRIHSQEMEQSLL